LDNKRGDRLLGGAVDMRTRVLEENIMTDFQFKALMSLVLDILNRSEDIEDAKRALTKLAGDFGSDESDD
jgi:hypothetical protein